MRWDITLFLLSFSFFFFNDTATTEIYTLSLHDALPISCRARPPPRSPPAPPDGRARDRKSTRLNSSHQIISYAVFCLKKKNKHDHNSLPKHGQCDTLKQSHTAHPR